MTKILLLFVLSLSQTTLAVGVFTCGGLDRTLKQLSVYENETSRTFPFPFSVISSETQARWTEKNLDLIFQNSKKFGDNPWLNQFVSMRDQLLSAGFKISKTVVKNQYARSYVDVYYSKEYSWDSSQYLIVKGSLVMQLTGDGISGIAGFFTPKLDVIGVSPKAISSKILEDAIPNYDRDYRENQSPNNLNLWDPSKEMTQHLRHVLYDLVVPLALKDPSIVEVGIEFPIESQFSPEDGRPFGAPQIFITRTHQPKDKHLLNVSPLLRPTTRWDGMISTMASFAGVSVFYKRSPNDFNFSPRDPSSALREKLNAGSNLLVYDFSDVGTQHAEMSLVSRTTMAYRPVFYHQATGTYEQASPTKKKLFLETSPVKDARYLFNFRKIPISLESRILALENGGFNPLIPVLISFEERHLNSDGYTVLSTWSESRIVTVRELSLLIPNSNVKYIEDLTSSRTSYARSLNDL